jgi:hypothetical protein
LIDDELNVIEGKRGQFVKESCRRDMVFNNETDEKEIEEWRRRKASSFSAKTKSVKLHTFSLQLK